MKIGPFKTISTESQELERVQSNITSALKPVLGAPIINGDILEDVVLSNGSRNTINHKLNRVLRGWIVIRMNAGADVWDEQADNVTPERTLFLQCSATVTISLWVF